MGQRLMVIHADFMRQMFMLPDDVKIVDMASCIDYSGGQITLKLESPEWSDIPSGHCLLRITANYHTEFKNDCCGTHVTHFSYFSDGQRQTHISESYKHLYPNSLKQEIDAPPTSDAVSNWVRDTVRREINIDWDDVDEPVVR